MRPIAILVLSCLCFQSLQAQKIDFETYFNAIEGMTYNIEKFDTAYYLSDVMLQVAETDREKGLANFAKGLVIVKNGWGYYLGEYGVPYLEKAINYFAAINDRKHIQEALNALSISFITIYNPDNKITSERELEYIRMALRIQHDKDYRLPLPFVVNQQDEKTNPESIKKTIKVIQDNLEFALQQKDSLTFMYRTEKLGYLYWQLDGHLERAEPSLLSAKEMAQRFNNPFFESVCLSQLAVYSNLSKNYQKGLEYAQEGLEHSQANNLGFRETIFRDQLYSAYLALGDKGKAIYHKSLTIEANEKLQRDTQNKRHKMVVDRIKELEYRNQLEHELSKERNRIKIYYTAMWGLLGLIAFALYSNYRLRQKNKEIKKAALSGQTIERKRVAADLHDNLGSTISSIQWTMDSIDQKELKPSQIEVFKNLQSLLQKAYGDIRLLAHNLLPLSLEEKGLAGSLEELVLKINKNGKTKFTLSVNENFKRLNNSTEFELYCIALELFSNIIHHADASEAHVELSQYSNKATLCISDNGKGYEPSLNDGMGLKNIKERVSSINGTWQVKRAEKNGIINLIEVNLS